MRSVRQKHDDMLALIEEYQSERPGPFTIDAAVTLEGLEKVGLDELATDLESAKELLAGPAEIPPPPDAGSDRSPAGT